MLRRTLPFLAVLALSWGAPQPRKPRSRIRFRSSKSPGSPGGRVYGVVSFPLSVTVCSAAMPPVLIQRADTGEVEELGSGGRPIGSRLSGAWTEHTSPLAPGDTLLFASDGFAEQLDFADQPLSYETLAKVLGAAASLSPRELLDRLLSRVAAWRGEREQGDDITFVAIRVT